MAEQSEANEKRAAFIADAPWQTSKCFRKESGYDAEEVHRYIRARITGE